jgi:hypothetical protein
MAKLKPELPILTNAELEAAREACAVCTAADRAAAAAKKEKEGALAQVFFKMGFPNMDEVKALEPAVLADTIERRVGTVFQLESKAFAAFALQKTSQGRYPKWKEELKSISGPAMIAQIEGETAIQYSYAVIEAAASAPGASGVFVLAPEPEVKSKSRAATK